MEDVVSKFSKNGVIISKEVIEEKINQCEEFEEKAMLLHNNILSDIDCLKKAIAQIGNDESNPYLNLMFVFMDDDTFFIAEILGFKERVKAYKDFLTFLMKIKDMNRLFYLFMSVEENVESICIDFFEMEEGHHVMINHRNSTIKTLFKNASSA